MIAADKAGRNADEEEDNGAALLQIGSTESGKLYTRGEQPSRGEGQLNHPTPTFSDIFQTPEITVTGVPHYPPDHYVCKHM